HGRLRGRRGARMVAITSGGAIPDNADYRVVLEPENTFIGSVNEDFAIESMAGDIFQLGNLSWRILGVQRGVVRVEDARGQPPNIPFWLGEAPARSRELSAAVAEVRGEMDGRLGAHGVEGDGQTSLSSRAELSFRAERGISSAETEHRGSSPGSAGEIPRSARE